MKKIYIIFYLLIFSTFKLFSQDIQKVDQIVDKYPASFSKAEKLAELINKDFKTDKEKTRAIYCWIAHHVKYDVDGYFSGTKTYTFTYSSPEEKERKQKAYEKDLAEQALKKKKAVCQGYSGLFKLLCDLTGVECVVIQGYSKIFSQDIGKKPKNTDHAWNAVKINGKWELVDVTWGAGNVDYAKKKFMPQYTGVYFMTSPERFFLKHFPEDKKWLFVDKSLEDFIELPLYYSNTLTEFEVIKPKNGIITVKAKDKIEIKWKTTLDPKNLNYAFEGEKYAKELTTEYKNGVLSFEIIMEKTNGKFLTFFYQGASILTYKIEKK